MMFQSHGHVPNSFWIISDTPYGDIIGSGCYTAVLVSGPGNGLVPDGSELFPEPLSIYHQRVLFGIHIGEIW